MTTDEIEERLLATLGGSHLRDSDAGKLQEPDPDPVALDEVIALGLDTNILKQLGRDTIFANNLVTTLRARSIPLVVPGQCVIEFWNNYQKFASDDAAKLQNEVNRLKTLLTRMGALSLAEGRLEAMQEMVDDITREVREATTSEYLEKSRLMMDLVLQEALRPMVSRVKFSQIAAARHGCKVPPGFADEARKASASYGDFYAWCDFLMGALVMKGSDTGGSFVFATDDSKPDWKTGHSGHPELVYEFRRVTGTNLVVTSYSDLERAIDRLRRTEADAAESEL